MDACRNHQKTCRTFYHLIIIRAGVGDGIRRNTTHRVNSASLNARALLRATGVATPVCSSPDLEASIIVAVHDVDVGLVYVEKAHVAAGQVRGSAYSIVTAPAG